MLIELVEIGGFGKCIIEEGYFWCCFDFEVVLGEDVIGMDGFFVV